MSDITYLVIHGSAKDSTEAIRLCGDALVKAGITGPSFAEGCITREKEYPTGLPSDIPVAIPHCSDNSITKDAICVLFLDHPVVFHRMDECEETVETSIIFNLAVKNPDEHIGVLQHLMAFLADSKTIEKCTTMSDADLIALLEKSLG
jgi:PTS system galactitol-specific IIA component